MRPHHSFPVRVYFEDTDFSGNVYHAAYLKFFERARTEWLRALGVHHSELAKKGVAFAVRHMDISFEAPAKMDDQLLIETALAGGGGARVRLVQTIRRSDETLCQAEVTVVAMTLSGRPTRLPETLQRMVRQI